MNWKKVFTIAALTGFSASVATGQGTAPTIVQGDYISNVFGNSNFIKNPNAKLNTKDVTVSSATVTRSTTTPLVATSEFNITTSTSTGYADWALRTFDQGMKGQNCEARFTYRGFSVGSTTAQILQGANVVAQLTLTPSTDPRIASINFPCGDLSAVTKFRLQQASASLTGTNEIGAIYTGLATNMANVAQAELVVQAGRNTTQTMPSAAYTDIVWSSESLDVNNEFNTTTGIFSPKKAGYYNFDAAVLFDSATWGSGDYANLQAVKNTQIIEISGEYYQNKTYYMNLRLSGAVYLNVGDTLKFQIYNGSSSSKQIVANEAWNFLVIKRFPSTSELVVTPERQNVFGGVKITTAAGNSNIVTSASWTALTRASQTRVTFGKADTASTTNYALTINNLPVGSYYISASGIFRSEAGGAGDATSCFFGLADTSTGGAQIAGIETRSNGDASIATPSIVGPTLGGVYNNTSVANRTFYLQGYRNSGTGGCYVSMATDMPVTITVIPLDQPSNSALYVQGPIKAAETGAAIPSGYAGQVLSNYGTVNIVNAWNNITNFTLPVGVWNCSGGVAINRNGATINAPNLAAGFSDLNSGGPSQSDFYEMNAGRLFTPTTNLFDQFAIGLRPMVIRSTGSQIIFPFSTISGSTVYFAAYVGTVASGTPLARWSYECVRIN